MTASTLLLVQSERQIMAAALLRKTSALAVERPEDHLANTTSLECGRKATAMATIPDPSILPRLLRFRDAPAYVGMDRNRFNSEVRLFDPT